MSEEANPYIAKINKAATEPRQCEAMTVKNPNGNAPPQQCLNDSSPMYTIAGFCENVPEHLMIVAAQLATGEQKKNRFFFC